MGNQEEFPVMLAHGAMRVVPAPVLAHGAAVLMRRIGRRHSALFRALTAFARTAIRIEPVDSPRSFILRLGGGPPTLTLDKGTGEPVAACVKGRLDTLVALLEGRLDSDTLFFSREITITGDTAVVVALRNTLDRESIDVMDEVAALAGPFAAPAKAAILRLEGLAKRIHARLTATQEGQRDTHIPAFDIAAYNRLSGVLHELRARLEKLEAKGRRREEPAA